MWALILLQSLLQTAYPIPRPDPQTDKGPAYIGITFDTLPNGIMVSQVAPASPAQQGGLRTGDLITKLNGEEIGGNNQNSDFVKRIAGMRPGMVIDAVVTRNTVNGRETVTKKIRLGPRPADFTGRAAPGGVYPVFPDDPILPIQPPIIID